MSAMLRTALGKVEGGETFSPGPQWAIDFAENAREKIQVTTIAPN